MRLVHGLCENSTAVVWNTGTLTDKVELHIAKHLKPHTKLWVLPPANAVLQRRAEADILPNCHEAQVQVQAELIV